MFKRLTSFNWLSTIIHQMDLRPWGERICVFAHFDEKEVNNTVVNLVKWLNINHWDIVFITTGDTLHTKEFEKLAPYCCSIIQRKNIGYDFGSYALGSQLAVDRKTKELLWCNDSVVGPYSELKTIEDAMQDVDFWGITDNLEKGLHLQSYFLHFSNKVLHHTAFKKFVKRIKPQKNKRKLIKRYELGLSTILRKAGFEPTAYVPSSPLLSDLKASPTQQANITIHFPITLLEKGSPFIKKQVLRENPASVDLSRLHEFKTVDTE